MTTSDTESVTSPGMDTSLPSDLSSVRIASVPSSECSVSTDVSGYSRRRLEIASAHCTNVMDGSLSDTIGISTLILVVMWEWLVRKDRVELATATASHDLMFLLGLIDELVIVVTAVWTVHSRGSVAPNISSRFFKLSFFCRYGSTCVSVYPLSGTMRRMWQTCPSAISNSVPQIPHSRIIALLLGQWPECDSRRHRRRV